VNQIGAFVGGVGLFLLGMRLMTAGLRMAAGDALRHILGQWTHTTRRGLFAGFLITALVQSSGAVTVATIGFVNAGLLTLAQSIGVIYGSNVGTTMTGWLVVLVGFQVDIQALSLPFVGVGAALNLLGRGRSAALGEALAGFGLFFLGIGVLKDTFGGLGQAVPIQELTHSGILGTLVFVGIGFVLTMLTQSSSAALIVVLTAAAGGLVPLQAAAAAVIGANVGTTSTAALAVIGATANAKRVAAAHVTFNVVLAAVAAILLPVLLAAVVAAVQAVGLEPGPATYLAVFHTTVKLLGVALFLPLTPRLVRWLEGHFQDPVEDVPRPHYLDKNVLATPVLAIDALALELARIGGVARTMAREALSTEGADNRQLELDYRTVKTLVRAVEEFCTSLQKTELPADIAEILPNMLRIARYYHNVADMALKVAQMQEALEPIEDPVLAEVRVRFRGDAVRLLAVADPLKPDYQESASEAGLQVMEGDYQAVKAQLLRAGAEGRIKVRQMVSYLDEHSIMRRMLEQTAKGAQYLGQVWTVVARYRHENQPEAGAANGAMPN